MIRLHDSLISGNGYKVRLLLTQLGIPFLRRKPRVWSTKRGLGPEWPQTFVWHVRGVPSYPRLVLSRKLSCCGTGSPLSSSLIWR
jgi:hypothetical protein